MKKAGYIVFFICLFELVSCLAVFVLLLCISHGVQSDGARAEEFLLSEPRHHFVNTTLVKMLDEGVHIEESVSQSVIAKYISPEGIEFISRSEAWDKADLELLYKELLRNKHGEEIYSLSRVTVYPQRDDRAAATHKNAEQYFSVPFGHTLLPDDYRIHFTLTGGQITLYNGDEITTAEGMANSLSHEYGHHYTRYHMLKTNGDELFDTEYAKLRGLNAENSFADIISVTEDFYYDNHYKFMLEIAAEDYVALMGSPASREIMDYKDSMELLYTDGLSWRATRCSAVQENLTLPMACEDPELVEYFYSFIEEDAPLYDIKKEMNIGVKKRSQSYNLTNGYKTFVYYEVTFDKVYGEDATYVLSVYDPEDYENTVRPVRTVTSGEKALCCVGNTVRNMGSMVRYNIDDWLKGELIFVVNVITSNGDMYTSAPFSYTF